MTWNEFIEEESKKDYFKSLMDYVKKEYMVSNVILILMTYLMPIS